MTPQRWRASETYTQTQWAALLASPARIGAFSRGAFALVVDDVTGAFVALYQKGSFGTATSTFVQVSGAPASLIAGPAPVGTATIRWSCGEDAGAVALANDGSSGPAGALTLAGAPVLGLPYPSGRGLALTGTNGQYATGGGAIALSDAAVSVVVTVLNTNLGHGAIHGLVERLSGAAGAGLTALNLHKLNDNGIIECEIATTAGTVIVTSAGVYVLRDNTAHVVGLTYDGATLRLWMDGEIAASAPQNGAIQWGAGEWTLGAVRAANPAGVQPWHGWIGDVRVYETALSQSAMRALYYQNVSRWVAP